ncbi:hypothetical protein L0Y65_04165 [Candidatus Micrarchaeota archaeon]|nr:hypothetical protein [Candidatus Micrarchaeota archaeon]
MSKYKFVSYLFVVLGLLVILGAAYVIIQYATGLINAVVDFVTTNDYSKLQQCGITPPNEFGKLKNEFATIVLPAMYLGLPGVLIIVSALMFLAGFYYHRGKLEDEARKHEELERQMVHKIVQKMETEKSPAPPKPSTPNRRPQIRQEPEEEPDEAAPDEEAPPEEEAEAEEAPEEEPEELPKPKPAFKKRK